jgi:hypothetical protein
MKLYLLRSLKYSTIDLRYQNLILPNRLKPMFYIDNIPQDDDRRQTMIQRDDEDLDDSFDPQSDEDRFSAHRGMVMPDLPTSSSSLPSTSPYSLLTPTTSRFLQRRPSAPGIVGKIRNVIMDRRRSTSLGGDSPVSQETRPSFQDEIEPTASGTQVKSNTPHQSGTIVESSSYPNLRTDLSSSQPSVRNADSQDDRSR